MKAFSSVGMKTWWITAQYAYDSTCSPLPFLAEHVISLNSSVDKSQFFDARVVKELAEILRESAGNSRLVFINIMGSHVKYDTRYPDDFARFKGSEGMTSPWACEPDAQKVINAYDNSILYTDFVLDQIIRTVENIPKSALIYFSDHGQDVFDEEKRFGHSINRNCGYEIPFFLWMSTSFKAWRGEEVQTWREYVTRPFMADCLGFFIADLLNIQIKSTQCFLSPLSKNWKPTARIASGYIYEAKEESPSVP